MSFGGPMVDHHGITRASPGQAQLAGLFGNALGYGHGEAGKLDRLQSRLIHATLKLRPGEPLIDYHTVDLGQAFMRGGWTTRGAPQGREGGPAATGTHIRYRHYLAGALCLVVVGLRPADEVPTLDLLATALERPARPLFVGRKTCLPAGPLLAGRVAADEPVAALRAARLLVGERVDGYGDCTGDQAEWPVPPGISQGPAGTRIERLVDSRDWANQIHGGERLVAVGTLPADGEPAA